MGNKVLQPDGTYCYSGPSCKKHGTKSLTKKLVQLIDSKPVSWRTRKPLPEWVTEKTLIEEQEEATNFYQPTGLKSPLHIPYWNEAALNKGFSEIIVDTNTSLLLDTKSMFGGLKERRKHNIWLVKQGKPVAYLSYLISPPENVGYWGETTIASIETHPDFRGQKYSTEIIKQVETHLINQKIHSNGHYTPTGAARLSGKLPYTKVTLEKEELNKKFGFRPEIGVHFKDMSFVSDWDNFETN